MISGNDLRKHGSLLSILPIDSLNQYYGTSADLISVYPFIDLHVTHIFSFRPHAPHVQFPSGLAVHGRLWHTAALRFWVISFYLLEYSTQRWISPYLKTFKLPVDISILRESLQIPWPSHPLQVATCQLASYRWTQSIIWTPALYYYNASPSYTFPFRCCNSICPLQLVKGAGRIWVSMYDDDCSNKLVSHVSVLTPFYGTNWVWLLTACSGCFNLFTFKIITVFWFKLFSKRFGLSVCIVSNNWCGRKRKVNTY